MKNNFSKLLVIIMLLVYCGVISVCATSMEIQSETLDYQSKESSLSYINLSIFNN